MHHCTLVLKYVGICEYLKSNVYRHTVEIFINQWDYFCYVLLLKKGEKTNHSFK